MLSLTALLFGVVAVRLVDLQVLSRGSLAPSASSQRTIRFPVPASRGSILDRNGRYLAFDVLRDYAYVDPTLVNPSDRARMADVLSPVLGVDEASILRAVRPDGDGSPRYEPLSSEPLSAAQVDALHRMQVPGVGIDTRSQRTYPNGDLARTLIGQAHFEGGAGVVGDAGIEARYDARLRGAPGHIEFEGDRGGRVIPGGRDASVEAHRGDDIVLTIDSAIQDSTERVLRNQIDAQDAARGVAIVLDIGTGEILALADYERDGVGDDDLRADPVGPGQLNHAVAGTYEPGSTNKIVTIASAIDDPTCGISADSAFDLPYQIHNGMTPVKDDWRRPQIVTTRQILAMSSNVGAAHIARQCFNAYTLDAAMQRWGFQQRPGSGVDGEVAGRLTHPDRYYDTGLVSTAIGYGVAATPLQVLDTAAVIANRGRAVHPQIVSAFVAPDGERREQPAQVGRRVVSGRTAAVMTDMMRDVITDGTAACAAIPGYEVAGKTGTARKFKWGRYIENLTTASFVGFAPADDPRLAAIVWLDEPRSAAGGKASAPPFSEIMEFALHRVGVAPAPTAVSEAQLAATAGADCHVPTDAEVDAALRQRAIAAQAAAAAAAEQADAKGEQPSAGRAERSGTARRERQAAAARAGEAVTTGDRP
jgi:cell division protein FtsI (penicillin-binding protein 3)